MAGETDAVRDPIQDRCNGSQDIAHVRLNLGAASLKHRAVLAVDNLNPQPFLN